MRDMINRSVRETTAALQTAAAVVVQPSFQLLILLLIGTVAIGAQLQRSYLIDVGVEEGFNADLPFLSTFHAFESNDRATYRWAADGASIRVPAVGGRAQIVELTWLAPDASLHAAMPATYRLTAQGLTAELRSPLDGRRHQLLLPPGAGAWLVIEINGRTFRAAGDLRDLLLPLDRIVLRPTLGWAALDWAALLRWAAALTVVALTLHQLVPVVTARRATAAAALLIMLAAALDGPRWAYGAEAALTATVAAGAVVPLLRRIYRRLIDPARADDLVLLTFVTFVLRFGGRLYPAAMMGDLGFHRNRFYEAIGGMIALVSLNRGIEFPYPPAPYLLVAPFVTLGFNPETALQIVAGLADAFSVPLVFLIARSVLTDRQAVLAAAVYVGTAATLLTHWWSFSTHIISQFLYLLVVLVLLRGWQYWTETPAGPLRRQWILGLAAVIVILMVGHFGYLINVTVLFSLLTAAVWWAAWRGDGRARAAYGPLTTAFVLAGSAALLFFYSSYLPLFLEQAERALSGGATAVAGRAPASRERLWTTLWSAGLVQHFGFFPVPLALVGVALLRRPEAWLWRRLSWLSLVVAAIFALLPFITLVSNSPRYLMFNLLPIAVGSAAAVAALWRRGIGARLAVVLMAGLVLLNSAWFWLMPMLYRLRPPEPF